MESRVAENLAKTESRAIENSVNMKKRVMQDSGARYQKKEKVLL
jgi:hypothetical protein